MGQHRDKTDRPTREAARIAAGHTLALWDYLLGNLPKGTQGRRDVACVAGFVLSMLVLLVVSVLMLGDWTSPPESTPQVRETVTVTVPAGAVPAWLQRPGVMVAGWCDWFDYAPPLPPCRGQVPGPCPG